MKRSEINTAIQDAKDMLSTFHWALPLWANWGVEDYAEHPDLASWLHTHQMGWDVTDFGSGEFATRGLVLFCVRNGIQSDNTSVPYAEKLLFIGEGQVTPFHLHQTKVEDIINRGGGDLIIEFRRQDSDSRPIQIRCDGQLFQLEQDEPLCLKPGSSATIPRHLYHRFYARIGGGAVLGGEVSQVNDDKADNFFLEPVGRFSTIIEDVAPLHPLWNELRAAS